MGAVLRLCRGADEDPAVSDRGKAAEESHFIGGDSDDDSGGGGYIIGGDGDAPRLDPKDFILSGLHDVTVVREPGSIAGQQFLIEECDGCDIYLLDNSAQVTVDLATNCRIFVGPCEGSVFLRDCAGCSVIVACQQFRTRDCRDISVLAHVSAGQPIVESSSGVRFGCYRAAYFSLREQFASAGLKVWNTRWSNVHDFTPVRGEAHWTFLPPGEDTPAALGFSPLHRVSATVAPDEESLACPVPPTWGERPLPGGEAESRAVVAVLPRAGEGAGFELIGAVAADAGAGELFLTRTRESRMTHADVAAGVGAALPAGTAAGEPGRVLILDFSGTAAAVRRAAAAATALGGGKAAMVVVGEAEAAAAAERLFCSSS